MIEACDLFEVHLTVRNLDEAIAFYRDVLGLTLAHVTSGRQAAFLWIGSARKTMLGLWAAGSAPQAVTLHTAFRVSWADVLAAPGLLRNAGITPLDFDGRPTDLPVVLAWMPAAAVYFRDPDGHLLEYIAMLPDEPRPDCGVVPWRTWGLMGGAPARAQHPPDPEQGGIAETVQQVSRRDRVRLGKRSTFAAHYREPGSLVTGVAEPSPGVVSAPITRQACVLTATLRPGHDGCCETAERRP